MLEHLGDIQIELAARKLEGWLIYDFRGQNPVAALALGLEGRTLTRRFFFWIPAEGIPVLVVHETEAGSFPHLVGDRVRYSGWGALRAGVSRVLPSRGQIAMEYCPMGSNPYLSWVDAGTLELVRSYGPTVVSSGDLVQLFLCRWSPEELGSHRRTAEALGRIKDAALGFAGGRLEHGERVLESEVQGHVLSAMGEAGLTSGGPPIVAAGPHTGNPHYLPGDESGRALSPGDLLLIDLSARETSSSGVFAELAWMAHVGGPVASAHEEAFAVVVRAREAALSLIRARIAEGRRVLGFEVDRAARDVVRGAGFGEHFVHRTGHHLGRAMNSGYGCTLDDFEIHDTRALVQGLAWSVHPGVYFEEFGVRTGLSVYWGEAGLEVHTPTQDRIEQIPALAAINRL